MEKYGFIYIWFDKKRKMYYIGSHWGTETDGYICSSNRMRDAYKRRPSDFKRRILKSNIDRNVLLEEEHIWLQHINDDELGNKYYNLRKHKWGHWSTDENKRMSVGQKISASPNRSANISKANKGRVVSEETRKKLSKSVSKTMTPEHRALLSSKSRGFKHTDEAKRKIAEAGTGRVYSEESKRKIGAAQKGKILSEETREKLRLAVQGKKRGPYKRRVKENTL
jgi:hypothetical protein